VAELSLFWAYQERQGSRGIIFGLVVHPKKKTRRLRFNIEIKVYIQGSRLKNIRSNLQFHLYFYFKPIICNLILWKVVILYPSYRYSIV